MPVPSKEIIKAAKAGGVLRIKELLATDPELINARDKDGSTPLHCATWKGQQEVVPLLLDAGAEVNAHNTNEHWERHRCMRRPTPIRRRLPKC